MKSIKKILLPTDFSETAQNAFRYCLRIADAYQADIELLHVVYPEYQPMDIPVMATKAMQDKADAAKMVIQEFVDYGLAQVQAGYDFTSIPNIKSDVEIGSPAGLIAEIAERDAADLIVIGTRENHNAFDKTFGSVTTSVVERAHCPVWVIPGEANFESIDIIAYATDLGDGDPYHIWKACQLLNPFTPILHVVHIGDTEASRQQMADMESFFTQNAPALQVNFHNVTGKSIPDRLDEFAENHDVDVMIMYAPYHTFWERIFQQSTTRKMALQSSIPVLFYKIQEE